MSVYISDESFGKNDDWRTDQMFCCKYRDYTGLGHMIIHIKITWQALK